MQEKTDRTASAVRAIAFAAIALVSVPYLWGHFHEPPGMVFMGFADHPYDQNSYLSRIQQASEGKFFIRRDFTLEEQRPLFFNPLTWTLGVVCRFTGVTPLAAYYGALVFYALLLLAVLRWFIGIFVADRRAALFAFALCVFSSGLCWLIPYRHWLALATRSPVESRNLVPISYWIAETITFETILSFPQFSLTAALMLLGFGYMVKGAGERTAGNGVRAGIAFSFLSFVHTVDMVTVGVVSAAWCAAGLIRFRRGAARATASGAIAALVACPAFLYMLYLFTNEPVFIEWSKERFISPHPLSYLIGYGLVLFLSLPELIRIARRGTLAEQFLAVWVIGVAILLYAPVSFQRRLSTAVHVPLCILAARFVFRLVLPLLRRWCAPRWGGRIETAVLAALVLATSPDIFVKVSLCIREMRGNPNEFYLPRVDLEAMRWMKERHNEDAAVLSSYKSGLYLPAYTGNRVFVGHWSETLRFDEKRRIADWVFHAPGRLEEKRGFLKAQGIRYVYYGTFERMRGPFAIEGAPFLETLYDRGGVAILRVVP